MSYLQDCVSCYKICKTVFSVCGPKKWMVRICNLPSLKTYLQLKMSYMFKWI